MSNPDKKSGKVFFTYPIIRLWEYGNYDILKNLFNHRDELFEMNSTNLIDLIRAA